MRESPFCSTTKHEAARVICQGGAIPQPWQRERSQAMVPQSEMQDWGMENPHEGET